MAHCGSLLAGVGSVVFAAVLLSQSTSAFVAPARFPLSVRRGGMHISSSHRHSDFARTPSLRNPARISRALGVPTVSMKAYTVEQDIMPDPCPADGVAMVFFSGFGDLRVHDHPGLAAAASAAEVHAVYVFDPKLLAGMTDRQIKLLSSSVQDLQRSLAALSIDMQIRIGAIEEELNGSIQAKRATHVYVHSEPTTQAQSAMSQAIAAAAGAGAQVIPWTAALRAGLSAISDDYTEYEQRLSAAGVSVRELSSSRQLLEERTATGGVGAAESIDVDTVIAEARRQTDSRIMEDVIKYGQEKLVGDREQGGESVALELWDKYKQESAAAFAEAELSGAARSLEEIALAREGAVAGALFEGETFTRAFRELLALGCLSPRVVALDVGKALSSVAPLPFGAAAAEAKKLRVAQNAVEAAEWHRILALVDDKAEEDREDREVFKYKYWRWRGHWVRYAEGGKQDGEPVVLVHGFGASADQWERVMARLEKDHRVFAIDKLGFGHSEKPEVTYTQYLWERNVQDFCLEVVGRPCFIAGNSIGGYTALGAATALASTRGLILINSAGRMIPADVYEKETAEMGGTLKEVMEADGLPPKNPPPQWLLDGAGNLAIALLRSNVEGFCKQVYPNNPDMVDDRLVYNIIRDSKDPGGYAVLASGAKLPPPRTKNELLQEFRRPLLVTQGLNDPLGGGISKYEQAHPEPGMVRLVGLEAGHCPHHEAPDEVSSAIRSFVSEVVAGGLRESAAAR